MSRAADLIAPARKEATRRGFSLPHLWAFVAMFLPVIAALAASLSVIDLAYHVRAGDIMLRSHHLIRTDAFTFTAFGRSWLDQQWGAQLVFALVYRAGAWPALALLRAALVGAIYVFVYLACRRAGAPVKRAAWLTVASFLVSVEGLGLRPQLLAMALFAFTVWVVFDRRQHPLRLWSVPLVVAFWANLHGSFFLGPLLVGLAWVEDLHRRSPRASLTLRVAVASVAAAVVNPFGLKVWTYAVGLSTNKVITRVISEWQPPTIRDVAGAVFFLSVVVVAGLLARRGRPTPWPSLLTLGTFFLIGLFAIRGIFWWALVAPPILAANLPPPRPAPLPAPNMLNNAIAAGLVLLAILFLPWWRTTGASGSYGLLDDAPQAITERLAAAVQPGDRIFSAQRWGSWFEFATPQNPVFVDSRIEVFPEGVWRDYSEVSLGQEGWQAVLDRWGVKVVVADRDQQAQLIPRIRRDPGWRLVSRDAKGFIFVRA